MLKWNGKINEAMVQHRLWRELEEAGIATVPQMTVYLPDGRRLAADLAILAKDCETVVGMVEVKVGKSAQGPRTYTRQYGKYLSTGLRWRYCEGLDEITPTVEWAKGIVFA